MDDALVGKGYGQRELDNVLVYGFVLNVDQGLLVALVHCVKSWVLLYFWHINIRCCNLLVKQVNARCCD